VWPYSAFSHSDTAVSLTIAQFVGGILGAGLVQLLTPYTVRITTTTLAPGMNYGQGLMLEAFLTAMLVFSVLMLAAEKHRATYLAPIGKLALRRVIQLS
jgi:aquaporin related protein